MCDNENIQNNNRCLENIIKKSFCIELIYNIYIKNYKSIKIF